MMDHPRDASAGYMMPDISKEQRAPWDSVEATRANDERNRANRPPAKPSFWQRMRRIMDRNKEGE